MTKSISDKETYDSSKDKDSENHDSGSTDSKNMFRKRHGYFPDKKKVVKPIVEKEKPLPELPEYPDYSGSCNICYKSDHWAP